MTHADGFSAWREKLWTAAVAGDEYAATDAALAALDQDIPLESLLLEVVAPVQARVGREWEANRITVAQEHTATAVNERVLAALAHHPTARAAATNGPAAGRVAVACIDGEWHAMPATRLPTAHTAVTACQATGTPVMAGGAAFGPDGRYARLLGADAWAADGRAAADRLAAGPLPRPVAPRQAVDDLPHLDDQEYTMVSRSARRLVRDVMGGLEERIPAVADYTPRQRRHTAEDVAHIVEFLAAALYVDDPELFGRFLTWTAGVLTARGVPAGTLLPALDLLGGRLEDFPRASALLAHGRDAVRAVSAHSPSSSTDDDVPLTGHGKIA
ncbi:cobalamin-binding protein [Nonomuraea sp. WAC 01424]|uniref:cobalamin B12-binding domain-containing protein n=1 Tax=Nonomuraea sp. WAC 01424 TaxID=2203200 RepID=UPI000F766123|nr:B12-binding domain-containing protein [Nonomuraea sp. WAC 01424]RSN08393.1 cobalamin-binding protein [Nonomuraea sp. WAC 01424]